MIDWIFSSREMRIRWCSNSDTIPNYLSDLANVSLSEFFAHALSFGLSSDRSIWSYYHHWRWAALRGFQTALLRVWASIFIEHSRQKTSLSVIKDIVVQYASSKFVRTFLFGSHRLKTLGERKYDRFYRITFICIRMCVRVRVAPSTIERHKYPIRASLPPSLGEGKRRPHEYGFDSTFVERQQSMIHRHFELWSAGNTALLLASILRI